MDLIKKIVFEIVTPMLAAVLTGALIRWLSGRADAVAAIILVLAFLVPFAIGCYVSGCGGRKRKEEDERDYPENIYDLLYSDDDEDWEDGDDE